VDSNKVEIEENILFYCMSEWKVQGHIECVMSSPW